MQHGKLTVRELLEQANTKTEFLLEDFIPKAAFGILVGEWGIGKSPFALQLQLSIAANLPFLGKWSVAGSDLRCLYVDMENSVGNVGNILLTQSKFIGVTADPHIEVYSPNYCKRMTGFENLNDFHYIKHLIKHDPVDFVIIDPLRMFSPQAESKNSEAANLIGQFREIIQQTGTTVLFIHHPRKPAADPNIGKYHLDADPTSWMANACGAASLIQNADFRIGLEDTEDFIVCRRFIRGHGWYPVDYIDRELDSNTLEPLGYVLKVGVEQMKPQERQWLTQLGNEFTTGMFLQCIKKSRTHAGNILKRWESLGVVKSTKKGIWQQT